jgi:HEAT repeats/PBS lyase HEAT-like repeat
MSERANLQTAVSTAGTPADGPPPLTAEESAKLGEFARACKAAARAVALYPAAHPAIATTLARLVDLTSAANGSSALKITVLPTSLLLAGRSVVRVDAAVGELAALLHEHLVGELTIHPGGDIEAWRSFLLLLARTPDSVRADGGIARLWMTTGAQHVELREIDYAEVLRERHDGREAVWERVIASCLEGQAFALSPEAAATLAEIAEDPQQFAQLVAALDERAAASGSVPTRTASLLRLLRGLADMMAKTSPDKLELVLRNMAAAVSQISPELMLDLLAHRTEPGDPGSPGNNDAGESPIVGQVVERMSDENIASFVANNVVKDSTATERLAQAFQTLVPNHERRNHLLGLAHDEAATTPLGQTGDFESMWGTVKELLTSYSDASYVSRSYGRELSGARIQAMEVERINDDPPERMATWRETVSPSALRALDLLLLTDLLRIEDDPARWSDLMPPVIAQIEDLLLVGDFDAADQLVSIVAWEAGPNGTPARREAAGSSIQQLADGVMMQHIVSHLATIDNEPFERIKSICQAIGEVIIHPLAEALSVEERVRTRERLAALLIAFGATGRKAVERLKNSQNPAVRRTAIYLLREFGGSEALPELTLLLGDSELQVQREAIRAMLNIGTDEAYLTLEQALTNGTPQSREAIMQAIGLVRDERATPLFVYILGHVDHTGPLRPVYLRAMESLGALRDPEAVEPLTAALYRGEWWAPRRTAQLRAAAASALARIGTPAAFEALRKAAASPSRGIRAVARPALERLSRANRAVS